MQKVLQVSKEHEKKVGANDGATEGNGVGIKVGATVGESVGIGVVGGKVGGKVTGAGTARRRVSDPSKLLDDPELTPSERTSLSRS